jgi:ureidoglycolate hydrolase
MMMIRARSLTTKNFAPFGRVVVAPSGSPTSQSTEYRFWSDIAEYNIVGEAEIGICTVYRRAKQQITGLERHLRTPEILIPIDAPFMLPLLLGERSEKHLQAFRVEVGEAVVIDRAVWHGACLPVGKKESSYFVMFRKNTPHDDVEKRSIKPFTVTI